MASKTKIINRPCYPGGIGTVSALGILFIALKLCHVIQWGWWYVLLPFYAVPALALTALAVLLVFCVLLWLAAAVAVGLRKLRRRGQGTTG